MAEGPVAEQAELRFGGLLRQLRDAAGLTQDELAEAAQVSQRAISDLERGINATARKDTAVLLAGALGLDGPARELFIAAARGLAPADKALAAAAGAGSAAAATRTLPRDIAAFTGRQAELGQLMARWAQAAGAAGGGVVSVHAIGGMAGIGKTTFAVHAGAARPTPLSAWATSTTRPGTTRPPPPAAGKRWNCSAPSATGTARARPWADWL